MNWGLANCRRGASARRWRASQTVRSRGMFNIVNLLGDGSYVVSEFMGQPIVGIYLLM
jgi:hypothetical protein